MVIYSTRPRLPYLPLFTHRIYDHNNSSFHSQILPLSLHIEYTASLVYIHHFCTPHSAIPSLLHLPPHLAKSPPTPPPSPNHSTNHRPTPTPLLQSPIPNYQSLLSIPDSTLPPQLPLHNPRNSPIRRGKATCQSLIPGTS